jgi:hypothetical protein
MGDRAACRMPWNPQAGTTLVDVNVWQFPLCYLLWIVTEGPVVPASFRVRKGTP